jgi:DNA-binding NtrC family response regulator
MSNTTVIYGEVVTPRQQRDLRKNESDRADSLLWHDRPVLLKPDQNRTTVYVDLDDPQFASPEFLVSVATAGERVRIVGKTENREIDDALRFSRLGVAEIISADECLERLQAVLTEAEETPAPPVNSRFSMDALIGGSPQTVGIKETIRVLAEVDFPSALILGETGTGKSLICRVLHNTGLRAAHNLVEVNCSAIPDELFESELFGHVKGAFTGAETAKQGLFEYARGGTLFLDEVGNLSASAQAKLLKILEDKKLRKVGAVEETDIDVRVVAATNLDLRGAIHSGRFREDLYYRLNLLTVEIPPLRERPSDIPALIDHYRNFYSVIYAKPGIKISPEATAAMRAHSWPGNVRELCNVVERAVLLCQNGVIEYHEVNLALGNNRLTIADRRQIDIPIPPQGITLDEIDQQVVKQVLNRFEWNKTETARFLGISRPRLRRIIRAAGLEQNRRNL